MEMVTVFATGVTHSAGDTANPWIKAGYSDMSLVLGQGSDVDCNSGFIKYLQSWSSLHTELLANV